MKVKELIKQLEKYNPNATIILSIDESDIEIYDIETYEIKATPVIKLNDILSDILSDPDWSTIKNINMDSDESIVYIKGFNNYNESEE